MNSKDIIIQQSIISSKIKPYLPQPQEKRSKINYKSNNLEVNPLGII